MRILYVVGHRFPTERAHGHQVAQVCDAMHTLEHSVSVVAPTLLRTIQEPPEDYYSLRHSLPVEYLQTVDPFTIPLFPQPFCIHVQRWSFVRSLRRYLPTMQPDLLYARSPHLLDPLIAMSIPIVLELHSIPSRNHRRFVQRCNRCALVICLTTPMREALAKLGVREDLLIVAPDAVDPERFRNMPEQATARERFAVQPDTFVIGYAGQLRSMGLSKGVEQLISACRILEEKSVAFTALIAGGPDSVCTKLTSSLPESLRQKVRFLGTLKREEIPTLYAACDALIYPAPKSDHPFYNRDTSPLKLFEYLASGKPIVCADLPPLRDVVNETNVRFCAPGGASSLALGIEYLIEHPEQAEKLSSNGLQAVQEYTWEQRMRNIFSALEQQTG